MQGFINEQQWQQLSSYKVTPNAWYQHRGVNGYTVESSSASRTHIVTLRKIFHNWTHSVVLGSSLYSLRSEARENTASNGFPIDVISGCLAIAQISLMCLPAATKQCMFLWSLHSNSTTHYNTVFWDALNCNPADIFIFFVHFRGIRVSVEKVAHTREGQGMGP
jgi:hypothetical protein